MIQVKGYQSYFGGKSGNGTYQTIINHIPPHRRYYSLYLGNCGVTRHIKPAEENYLNDLDAEIINAWQKSNLPHWYHLTTIPALNCLESLLSDGLDNAEMFIYLDPPYLKSTRRSQRDVYNYEMTEQDHIELLKTITRFKSANIMISHYPCDLYNEYLSTWNKKEFYSMIRNGLALEAIYYNYTLIPGVLHDYSFIGEDFRERERFTRIKKNFVKKLNRLEPELRNAIMREIQK